MLKTYPEFVRMGPSFASSFTFTVSLTMTLHSESSKTYPAVCVQVELQ